MAKAKLISIQDSTDLRLVVNVPYSVGYIIKLAHMDSVFDLFDELTAAIEQKFKGWLEVTIDGINYSWPESVWKEVAAVVIEYITDYFSTRERGAGD